MTSRRAVLALGFLLLAGSRASAQTVSPSDFDPTLRARDAAILRRVAGRVGTLGESGVPEAPPKTATFTLALGKITTEESWLSDPTTGEDVLRGRVIFTPGPAAPACASIRMVQAARVESKLGTELQWSSGQQNRNLMRTSADAARGIGAGYFVDHDAIKCAPGKPCSPYFRDSWPNPDESADGGNGSPASLVDYPFGWTYFERISLETCARCADTGKFLGCATWGGTWPTVGDRALRESGAADAPSATFLEAFGLFDGFYPPAR